MPEPKGAAAEANSTFAGRKSEKETCEAARIAAGEPDPDTTRARTTLRAGFNAENPALVMRDVRA